MANQKYDQFRTFLTTEAREVLFVKQEPEIWDHYFDERLASSYASKVMDLHCMVEWVVGNDAEGNLTNR